jgi:hypothetical protein
VTPLGAPAPNHASRFAYFVLQTRIEHGDDGVSLSGVLEDLGTGEKRAFTGGDGLARLVADWVARSGEPP